MIALNDGNFPFNRFNFQQKKTKNYQIFFKCSVMDHTYYHDFTKHISNKQLQLNSVQVREFVGFFVETVHHFLQILDSL